MPTTPKRPRKERSGSIDTLYRDPPEDNLPSRKRPTRDLDLELRARQLLCPPLCAWLQGLLRPSLRPDKPVSDVLVQTVRSTTSHTDCSTAVRGRPSSRFLSAQQIRHSTAHPAATRPTCSAAQSADLDTARPNSRSQSEQIGKSRVSPSASARSRRRRPFLQLHLAVYLPLAHSPPLPHPSESEVRAFPSASGQQRGRECHLNHIWPAQITDVLQVPSYHPSQSRFSPRPASYLPETHRPAMQSAFRGKQRSAPAQRREQPEVVVISDDEEDVALIPGEKQDTAVIPEKEQDVALDVPLLF
jgi:hypothetical protein